MPPWGGRVNPTASTSVQPSGGEQNPLAALPWMPDNYWFILLIVLTVAAIYISKGKIIIEEEKC